MNKKHHRRILVIGGNGFLGRRVCSALQKTLSAEVWVGSRHAQGERSVTFHLEQPQTFAALGTFDCVVNCADTSSSSSLALAQWCWKNGITFLETTADTKVLEEIWRWHAAIPKENHGAVLLLGIGLFPGLSNLLAAEHCSSLPSCQQLEVGVRVSPFSGAGPGICALMVKMAQQNTPCYEAGQRIERAPVSAGMKVPFGNSTHQALQVGLAVDVQHRLVGFMGIRPRPGAQTGGGDQALEFIH